MSNARPLTELSDFRKERGLSQGQLAEMIGVTRTAICRWEKGRRRLDDELVPLVASKTGIPVAKLRPDLAALFQDDAA